MKNKQNEDNQDGWKGKQNNRPTAKRLYRKHKKHSLLNTIKLTENTDIRKAMAIHWREASDGQEHWCTEGGWNQIKLAHRPICWRCSLWPRPETGVGGAIVALWGRLTCQRVSLRDNSRRGQWTCRIHRWFRLQLVESSNCQEGHCISGICRSQHQLLHCLV